MPRKRKNKGYNKRAHAEHPGVSIQVRRGMVVLRYREPGTVGSNGRPIERQEAVYHAGTKEPITSREKAKPYAIAKSKQLAEDQRRQEQDNVIVRADMTWAQLQSAHRAELIAKNRAPKTLVCYDYLYKIIDSWMARPLRPATMRRTDLINFIRFLRARKDGQSEATVRSIARHFKALLNYGRSSDQPCVRLGDMELRKGLDTGRKTKLVPVALSSAEIRTILMKANEYDADHARHAVFPFIAFLIMSGCRRGEAASLRWMPSKPAAAESWCDFDDNKLYIYGVKTRVQRVVSLKSRGRLRELLEVLRKSADVIDEPFVFGGHKELSFGDKKRVNTDRLGRDFTAPMKHIKELAQVNFRIKDFRSSNATFLANSHLFANLYGLAGELGHDYAVLVSSYATRRELPIEQRNARDVADIIGIGDLIDSWIEKHRGSEGDDFGAVIPLLNAG